MIDTKIIQIIPAPNGMWAKYKNEDVEYLCRLACLALVEDSRTGGQVC